LSIAPSFNVLKRSAIAIAPQEGREADEEHEPRDSAASRLGFANACGNRNRDSGEVKMERETASSDSAGNAAVVRRWLKLEQLLDVLPLKKSYVYYLTHTRQIPVTRIGRRLLFDYDRIVRWLEERTAVEDASTHDRGRKHPSAHEAPRPGGSHTSRSAHREQHEDLM
jgi:excisionase family DNA binding protein